MSVNGWSEKTFMLTGPAGMLDVRLGRQLCAAGEDVEAAPPNGACDVSSASAIFGYDGQ